MKRCKKSQKISFTIDDYIRANKAINRLEELERNGGHWTAVNRPHKNKKKYDRKRDRKIDSDGLFNFGNDILVGTNTRLNAVRNGCIYCIT